MLAAGGIAVAVLLALMSIAGLGVPEIYARELPAWTSQAIAQDWFDLVIATPMLVVAALWAARDSRRGLLVYAGTLLFAVYTLVIYAFAVHLNVLFLVYCAALGIALYTLIGVVARLWLVRHGIQLAPSIPHRSAGGFLVAIGIVFALLWLSQLIPAVVHGTVPRELAETGLLTNPIHVLDLSFILPLHVIAGIALWRMRSERALLAPIVLVFGALMAGAIAVLSALAGSAAVAVVMALIAAVSTLFSVLVVRAVR